MYVRRSGGGPNAVTWVAASIAVVAVAAIGIALAARGGTRVTPVNQMALAGTATASAASPAAATPAAATPAAATPAATASPTQTASASAACPNVNVVFARGTGEPPGLGMVGTPFASAVAAGLPGMTVTDYAVNYAANVSQTSAGPGATDMSQHIVSMAAQCPNTQFVIGGYSQGASVTDIAIGIPTSLGTGMAIPASLASRIDAVVAFGNPLRLSGQTIVADSALYGAKADEFCNVGDPVCGNGADIAAHLMYAANGDAAAGAQFAAQKVTAALMTQTVG